MPLELLLGLCTPNCDLTPFRRRGFAANGTPRGPAFARPPRPKTTDSAALFWQRYGTKCKKGIAMRSALILRDFGQISAGKRACPCHQGLTVIRETQTGYSLSCLRVPDLGPPYRSAPGRERFPCIARAQYDSAAPRFSSSLENDACHNSCPRGGKGRCERV